MCFPIRIFHAILIFPEIPKYDHTIQQHISTINTKNPRINALLSSNFDITSIQSKYHDSFCKNCIRQTPARNNNKKIKLLYPYNFTFLTILFSIINLPVAKSKSSNQYFEADRISTYDIS